MFVKLAPAAFVAVAMMSQVTALSHPSGRIVPSATRSRRLSTGELREDSPTSKDSFVELDAFNLKDLNTPHIELQFQEDEYPRFFYGITYDKETWYGEDHEGSGFLHLVLPSGSTHLSGMIQDQDKSYGIWTRRDGTVFATVEEHFHVSTHGNESLHQDHEKSLASPMKTGNVKRSRSSRVPANKRHLASWRLPGGKKGKTGKKPRVDIMVLYSNDAMCGHAGLSAGCHASKDNREAIEAEAKLNVAITNVAFAQSGINAELKLVHLDVDNYWDEVPTDTDDCSYREILQDDDEGNDCNAALTPSLIHDRDDVHDLRDRHGADIVAYFLDKNYNDRSGMNGISGGDELGVDEKEAYILVNRNSRFHFVFTHELGHIFGAQHRNSHCNMRTNPEVDETFRGPCFKTLMVQREDNRCQCFNPDANVDRDFIDPETGIRDRVSRTMIVPRIPLFANPNLSWSGHNLESNLCFSGEGTSQCPNWSCFPCGPGGSAAEIIEAHVSLVAGFRDPKPSHHIPLVFGLVGLSVFAGTFYAKKKRAARAATLLGN